MFGLISPHQKYLIVVANESFEERKLTSELIIFGLRWTGIERLSFSSDKRPAPQR